MNTNYVKETVTEILKSQTAAHNAFFSAILTDFFCDKAYNFNFPVLKEKRTETYLIHIICPLYYSIFWPLNDFLGPFSFILATIKFIFWPAKGNVATYLACSCRQWIGLFWKGDNQDRIVRDFKLWYGEAVVRRQIVKITYGDVMTRVPLRLSRRRLAFYYEKVPSFTYSSLPEYNPTIYFSFERFFPSLNSLVQR